MLLLLAVLLHLVYLLFLQQVPGCEDCEAITSTGFKTKEINRSKDVVQPSDERRTTNSPMKKFLLDDLRPKDYDARVTTESLNYEAKLETTHQSHELSENLSQEPYLNPIPHPEDPAKKIIFYTKFFGNTSWAAMLGNATDLEAFRCPVSNCVFSYDKSQVSDADAVVFHALDYDPYNIPKVRYPNQRYIWLTIESPGLQGAAVQNVDNEPFFNWTCTYSRKSDIVFLYGGLMTLDGESQELIWVVLALR